MWSIPNTAAARTPIPRHRRVAVRRRMTRTTTASSTPSNRPSPNSPLGGGFLTDLRGRLDAGQRRVHALDQFPLEAGHPAEQCVDREVGYRLDAILGVPALHDARALGGRLQLVAPDRAVGVDPKRELALRDHLDDGARRRPEEAVTPIDIQRA